MNLEDVIRDAPNFQVVTRGETAKESARNVYDLALSLCGLEEADDEGSPIKMIIRAASMLTALISAARRVEYQIHEELGLVGGATGPANFADLSSLDAKESLKLFHISATVKELESMKPDLLSILRKITGEREAA